jgi:hypothetical protein
MSHRGTTDSLKGAHSKSILVHTKTDSRATLVKLSCPGGRQILKDKGKRKELNSKCSVNGKCHLCRYKL